MPTAACRLFVIQARDEPVAVILRRGPSKWYQLIRWEMRHDAFDEGAWFHGRIYEDRCDLSPNGSLFVYFCHGGAYREGYTDSWTAVSRPPWLFALILWPWGTTYGGGGRFVENGRLHLRSGCEFPTHPDHPLVGLEVVPGPCELHRSTFEIPDAEWCGRDYKGRLIFTRGGKLFRRGLQRRPTDIELADFSRRRPAPKPSPDWARRPLSSLPKKRNTKRAR